MELRDVVEGIVGEAVARLSAVGGGDIGRSARAILASGERLFVKHYPTSPSDAVAREAEGLDWLAEADAVPVANVRGVDASHGVLVLDWIEPGRATRTGDADFGRGLAALHRFGAERFGDLPDNYIGSLPQSNRSHATWAAFLGEERIAFQARRAAEAGRFSAADLARVDRLVERLPERVGPHEPPARLHGDLWGGNRLADADGRSWLIDPAAYGGHREMDLAMMRLFGGFSERVFDAYHEAHPLAPGAEERVALCQLYPVLVHANLFGGGYVDSARRIIARYL
jgi:fructosamine-3-kinase